MSAIFIVTLIVGTQPCDMGGIRLGEDFGSFSAARFYAKAKVEYGKNNVYGVDGSKMVVDGHQIGISFMFEVLKSGSLVSTRVVSHRKDLHHKVVSVVCLSDGSDWVGSFTCSFVPMKGKPVLSVQVLSNGKVVQGFNGTVINPTACKLPWLY